MRSRVPALAFFLSLATGCVAPGDDSPTDPPAEDTTPAVPDGTHGTLQVRLSDGVTTAHYIVQGGRMIWEGDIDLGPASAANVFGFAIKGMDHRWPDGRIPWVFEDNFNATDRQTILDAMKEWNRITPVHFNTVEGTETGRPFIGFFFHDGPGSSTTGIGPDGTGAGDETDVNIHVGSARSTVMHELGHALGLKHEHMRPDRDAHVKFRPDCVISDELDQFDIQHDDGLKEIGAYDVHSIMHYSATTWCQPPLPGLPSSTDHGNCICYPLLDLDTFDGHDQETGFFEPSSSPDHEDQRVITRMYEPVIGKVEANDKLGSSSVTGDFDGDGYDDLAIGAPGERPGSGARTGAVFLYRGTGVGLVAWGFIDESSTSAPQNDGDDFGFALAAADFDRDGRDDLVVGAPGNRMGVGADTGQVFVYLSAEGGPLDDRTIVKALNQNNTGVGVSSADERFGAALAIGDVTGDGKPDLAVGVPGEVNAGVKSGYVHTFKFATSTGSFVSYDGVRPPSGTQANNDRFGAAIAIVDVNGGGKGDLVIGAPSLATSTKPGSVFVYLNGVSSFTYNQSLTQSTTGADAPAPGDRFGAAITTSPTTTFWPETLPLGREPQIFVGAPGKDNPTDSGRVFNYMPTFGVFDAYTGLDRIQQIKGSVSGTPTQAGDAFGSSLAVADFDFDDTYELIAGAPKKDNTAVFPDIGMYVVFRVSAGIYQGVAAQLEPPSFPLPGTDRFGSVLAIGDYDDDHEPDLAVGTPGRANDAGRIYVFDGPTSGVVPTLNELFDEDTATPE